MQKLPLTKQNVFLKLFVSVFFVLFTHICGAQSFLSDVNFIKQKHLIDSTQIRYYKRAGNNQAVMQNHHHSIVSKYNPITLLLKGSMFFYQNVLSPQLSKTCAYQITCSNFSKQAIQKFGIVKGVFLSADRIMRCNRIAILDVNPMNVDEFTGTIIDPLTNY